MNNSIGDYTDVPYVNKDVKCPKCGSYVRKHTHNHSFTISKDNDEFMTRIEKCYDCGGSIKYKIKYIHTHEIKDIELID